MTSFGPAERSPTGLTVSLEADLLDGQRPPKDLRLLARQGNKVTAHRSTASDLERIAGSRFNPRSQVFHWRVSFEVPAAVAADPRVSFELIAESHTAFDLPALGGQPGDSRPLLERSTTRTGACLTFAAALLAGLAPTGSFRLGPEPPPALELPPLGWQTHEPRPIYERPTPRIGVFLASAAALLAGLAPGFALADSGSGSGSSTASTTTSTAITQSPSTETASASTTTTTTSTAPATITTTKQPPSTTSQAPPPTTTQTTATATTTTTTTATTTTTTTPTATRPGRGKSSAGGHRAAKHLAHRPSGDTGHHHRGASSHHSAKHHLAEHHPGKGHDAKHHSAHRSGGAPSAPPVSQPAPETSGAAVVYPAVGSGGSWTVPVMADPFTSSMLRTYAALVGGLDEPPVSLQKIYRAAGGRYGVPWQVLAAINYVETRYGKDLAVSPAGAVGWMQFMPATWAQYGESVNLKGKPAPGMPNPWDPTDAIFAAARYLKAAGAGRDLPGAVYAYNHAGWYVQEVLSIAEQINRHNMWPQRHASRKLAAMLTMARMLNGLPYVWGGGHADFTMIQSGYDCSGFVSAVLHAGGYLEGPQTTQTLAGQPLMEPGRGRFVTIRDRTYLSADQDHVIIDINGQWWESGGWGVGSDRVHRMHDVPRAYLDTFNLILHPRGL